MIPRSDIEPLFAALTLACRRPAMRGKWLRRGIGRYRVRLTDYWHRRISQGIDVELFHRIRADFLAAKAKSTPIHGVPGSVVPKPTLTTMAKTATASLSQWAKNGFRTVLPDQLEGRMTICRSCPKWDADAYAGTGRCQICGCSTAAKLRLSHEKCPEGRWGPQE